MTTAERLNPEKITSYINKICEDRKLYRNCVEIKNLLRKDIYNLTNELLDFDTIDEINLNHIHIMFKLYFYAILLSGANANINYSYRCVPFNDISGLKELFIKSIYATITSSGNNEDLEEIKNIRQAYSIIFHFEAELDLFKVDIFTQEIKHLESMDNELSNPTYIPEYLSLDIKPILQEEYE